VGFGRRDAQAFPRFRVIILVRGFGLFRFLMLDDKGALGWWRSYPFGLTWFGRGVSGFELGL
jgi:hypothetical protein